jgi:hypothetical protein
MAEKSLIMLQQENAELRKENQGLKETLEKALVLPSTKALVPYVPNGKYDSAEEKIVEEQINVLEAFSAQRGLTLKEIKALDILIKNKTMIKSKKPIEPDWRDVSEKTPEAELLRLAGDIPVEPTKAKPKVSKKNPLE